MTDSDKILSLLAAYAKSTLLVATRMNALERAMQKTHGSVPLWDNYAKELGLEQNRADLLRTPREVQVDRELADAIAELRQLLSERKP
jgi:hypothetical protein